MTTNVWEKILYFVVTVTENDPNKLLKQVLLLYLYFCMKIKYIKQTQSLFPVFIYFCCTLFNFFFLIVTETLSFEEEKTYLAKKQIFKLKQNKKVAT